MNNFRKSYFKIGAAFAILMSALISCGGATAAGDNDSGDGGNTPDGTYAITIADSAADNITADKKFAAAGDTVTLSVKVGNADGWLVSGTLIIENAFDSFEPDPISIIDGAGTDTYSFYMPDSAVTVKGTFQAAASTDATLNSLATNAGSIVQSGDHGHGFDPAVLAYYLEIPYETTAVDFTFQANNQGASVANPSGGDLENIPVGKTTFSIVVTAQNGTATATYTVQVARLPDASLSGITISATDITTPIVVNVQSDMTPVIPYFDSVTPPNLIVAFTASSGAAIISSSNITISSGTATVVVGKGATVNAQVTVSVSENSVFSSKIYTLNLTRPGDANAPDTDSAMATGGELRFIRNGQNYEEVHIFKTTANNTTFTGTLAITRAPASAKVFIVAGGGGGGKSSGGIDAHGGGAGGVINVDNQALPVGDYAITVGKGGNGGNTITAESGKTKEQTVALRSNGANSSIVGSGLSLIAIGGGGGGWHAGGNGCGGGSGGSGGGGITASGGAGGGTGTVNQGKAGGSGAGYFTCGGGGYTEAGTGKDSRADADIPKGGAGLTSPFTDIDGIPASFAGGGAAGKANSTASDGGGVKSAGTPNTGGGGASGMNTDGYEGGSGIVIVRFPYIAP
jgi:hypothetical protein